MNARSVRLFTDTPLALREGGELSGIEVAYETWGTYDPERSNAVLVCHALTGDAHVAMHGPDDTPGWWDGIVGPGAVIDTRRFFVICSNVLGGCSGTLGPADPGPDGEIWGESFPVVTIQDMVQTQAALLDALGVSRLKLVIGGSMGGMQALQWAVSHPDRVELCVAVGATDRMHPMGIAFNEVQRQAIRLDPAFGDGRFPRGAGPASGLALARMIATITYRSDPSMQEQFGRRRVPPGSGSRATFEVERYLHHQGDKLVRRFDARSYLTLSRAMDLFDIYHGSARESLVRSRVKARVRLVGIASDILFPPEYSRRLVQRLRQDGVRADYRELTSMYGHDAFLRDIDEMETAIADLLGEMESACASHSSA